MVTVIFLSHNDYADNDAQCKHSTNEIVSVVTVISLSHNDYADSDAPF